MNYLLLYYFVEAFDFSVMKYVIKKIFMLIIERRATANHAEYGPILAHMGRLFAEIGLQSEPISTPGGGLGATTGRKTGPSAQLVTGSPPGGDFYAP